jgi:Luciferase-like monooxygenase
MTPQEIAEVQPQLVDFAAEMLGGLPRKGGHDLRRGLGIGAAWNEQEFLGLGIPFPPVAERFERLEETLEICLQMWRGDETPYEARTTSSTGRSTRRRR